MPVLKSAISIVDIDAILPQTQCGQCGYDGCKPYAEAIYHGDANINQCPPGGSSGIKKMAALLEVDFKPLDQSHGITKPHLLALIEEQRCIGCTLCIQACPVDAIIGTAKHMHTVLHSECTGCELCISPCPVDCITMALPQNVYRSTTFKHLTHGLKNIYRDQRSKKSFADKWRDQYQFRLLRLAKNEDEKAKRLAERENKVFSATQTQQTKLSALPLDATSVEKREVIAAAIARAKARKAKISGQQSPTTDNGNT